ncbi:MAG: DUF4920 domain-containing protein [Cellvibrionaceae bacterium]
MKNKILALSSAIFFFLALSPAVFSNDYFGEPITLESTKMIKLEEAIDVFEKQSGENTKQKSVLITAKVNSICEAKGCWMGLKIESGDVRVTFKNYGFFVPPTLVGQNVDIQGTITKVTLSLKDTKHYVKDSGGDPDTITEPQVEYQIIATGVRIHQD